MSVTRPPWPSSRSSVNDWILIDSSAKCGAESPGSGTVSVMTAPVTAVPIARVLAVLQYRWKRWLILLTLTTVTGLVAALLVPRRYEGELVALPRGTERNALLSSLAGQFGGLAALTGLGSSESGQRAEAIQLLQSQILAREFILDNKLLPVLFASDWDERRQSWKWQTRTLNDAVELFDRHIRDVTEDRRSGLVTVRITWKNPIQAAAWANELVRRANDRLRRRAVARAQGAIDYLKREARAAEAVEVQQTLYRLMEEQYKTLVLANVSEDYAFYVIDRAVAAD